MAEIGTIFSSTINDVNIDSQVKFWDKIDILKWSKTAKDKTLEEKIAVAMRANQIDSGHMLRYTQIISLIILLNNVKGKGKLVQIATGEGKYTITEMLASIKALSGETVDVVTSSSILAIRDQELKRGYFDLLGLSSSNNIGNSGNEEKECYKSKIVYGDAGSFQGDILRHEFKGYNIRGERGFGAIIVDEVDSMLVDDSSNMVKLSSPVSGMEYLEPLLCSIWLLVNRISRNFVYLENDNKLVYIDGNFEYKDGQLTLLDGTIENQVSEVLDKNKFIGKIVENYIEDILLSRTSPIPNHLVSYVKIQKESWGEAASSALHLEENKHYVIKIDDQGNQVISPVNYASTGVVQDRTQWGDGMHQFLQIKHGLKITAETLTSCFISNLAFFKRYGGNIFGMTGTLGSHDAKNLLSSIYDIDYANIPTYKEKKFIELGSKLTNSKEEKIQNIVNDIEKECAIKNRSALIICETIAEVESLTAILQNKFGTVLKIRHYARNDMGNLDSALDVKEVIVSTNLAGRGTDLKTTKELDKVGGSSCYLKLLAEQS